MGLEFEPVSVEQARKALDEAPVTVFRTAYPVHTFGQQHRRRPETMRDKRLMSETFQWLYELPRHERPIQLALKFPRIANNLADRWRDRDLTMAYMHDLLVDNRGGRRGFPAPVVADLLRLRSYVATPEGSASH